MKKMKTIIGLLSCGIMVVPAISLVTSCSNTSSGFFYASEEKLTQSNSQQQIVMSINNEYWDDEISSLQYSFTYFNANTNEKYSTKPNQIISADGQTGKIIISDYSKELKNDIKIQVDGTMVANGETYKHTLYVLVQKDTPEINFDNVSFAMYERNGSESTPHNGIIKQQKTLTNYLLTVESNEFVKYSSAAIEVTGKLADGQDIDTSVVSLYEVVNSSNFSKSIGINIAPNTTSTNTHYLQPIPIKIDVNISILGVSFATTHTIYVQLIAD